MHTSLTPEFWQHFAALLAVAIAVTVVLSAALDALAVRLRRHPARRAPHRMPRTPTHC